MLLKDKIVLITGSNRGVGLSMLKKFSENGAEIIACARKQNSEFGNQGSERVLNKFPCRGCVTE